MRSNSLLKNITNYFIFKKDFWKRRAGDPDSLNPDPQFRRIQIRIQHFK
jgi:hypothetical protein